MRSTSSSDIEPGYRTDHSVIILSLQFEKFERGRGLWKFNNSLLYDKDFLELINNKIQDIKKQYAVPVYNFDNIENISNMEIGFTINDQLFLETLLMEIRGKTISYSSYIKKQKIQRENLLSEEINRLEQTLNEDTINLLNTKKNELENIRKERLKGAFIRSRAKWIEEGEKPSKYFCHLESRNFTNKLIPKIVESDGTVIKNQKEILEKTKSFYQSLYGSREDSITNIDLENELHFPNIPKLSQEESSAMEGEITLEEAGNTLKNMKSNRSPGSDGFTCEFFKTFWKQIGAFVVRSINYAYQEGHLSVTQKQGIITCLPKGDKPRHFLKNWRPISLLNTVYKIASGSIACRMKNVLHKIIHTDQTGFISGRYIGENSRLIYDIMEYTEQENIPGLLLLIDFEKAFDSVSWSLIQKVTKFFNFGDSIRKWISVFYTDISARVNHRGVTIQENRIAIYCDIFSLYCDILRYIPFLIFSVKLIKFLNIRLNFEPYVILVIESELYTCKRECMKTFYKGKHVTGMHLLDLQLLQDKNWMKNKQFNQKKEKSRYIAIRISYCDTI